MNTIPISTRPRKDQKETTSNLTFQAYILVCPQLIYVFFQVESRAKAAAFSIESRLQAVRKSLTSRLLLSVEPSSPRYCLGAVPVKEARTLITRLPVRRTSSLEGWGAETYLRTEMLWYAGAHYGLKPRRDLIGTRKNGVKKVSKRSGQKQILVSSCLSQWNEYYLFQRSEETFSHFFYSLDVLFGSFSYVKIRERTLSKIFPIQSAKENEQHRLQRFLQFCFGPGSVLPSGLLSSRVSAPGRDAADTELPWSFTLPDRSLVTKNKMIGIRRNGVKKVSERSGQKQILVSSYLSQRNEHYLFQRSEETFSHFFYSLDVLFGSFSYIKIRERTLSEIFPIQLAKENERLRVQRFLLLAIKTKLKERSKLSWHNSANHPSEKSRGNSATWLSGRETERTSSP